MKGKNDQIYKIFHWNAEERQISKEVSDQKSKLVFRSIWTTDEWQIRFIFIEECHGLDALKTLFFV